MSTLTELLDTQVEQLEQLVEITQNIRISLLQRNIDEVTEFTAQEEKLLLSIQETDANIALQPDKDLLKKEPLHSKVKQSKELLEKCHILNEANKQHIEMSLASMHRFHQLLVLSRNNNSLTYNNKGKTHTSASSGSSIKA